MIYKYELSCSMIKKVVKQREFANGGSQVSVLLNDGTTYNKILISGSRYIVAMRGETDLPFDPRDIVDIFQESEDEKPQNRGGWDCWDDWS